MSSRYLRFRADEAVKVGALTLPGVVTGIEVDGELEIEEQALEDISGAVKLVKGFKDAKVVITLEVLPDDGLTVEQQVASIESAFKVDSAEGSIEGKIQPYRMVNTHLDARNIQEVMFKRFVSRQGNDDEAVYCDLHFAEYAPVVADIEAKIKASQTSGQASGVGVNEGGAAGGGTPGAAPPTTNPDGSPKTPGALDPYTEGLSTGLGATGN